MALSLAVWDAAAAILPAASAPSVGFTDGTNFDYMTLDFDPTTSEDVHFFGVIPQFYSGGTITVRLFWTATSTGNVVWRTAYLGRVNDEVLDSALSTVSDVTDSVTAANDLMVASVSFTSPALVAGDFFVLLVRRVGANASDTLAVDAKLLAVELQE